MNVIIFGVSCVGKSTLKGKFDKTKENSLIFESDDIKEAWCTLRGHNVPTYDGRLAKWHDKIRESDIKDCKNDWDYARILRIALEIIDDDERPFLYFASHPLVVEGLITKSAKAIFLTACERELCNRAEGKNKLQQKKRILKRNKELANLAKKREVPSLDTSDKSQDQVFSDVLDLIGWCNSTSAETANSSLTELGEAAMSEHFTLNLTFNTPVEQLYDAIATKDGPSQWWSQFCETSDTVGGVSKFRFPKAGFFANMEIKDLRENELIEWKCLDSRHPKDSEFSDLRDWVGTTLRFHCERVDDDTSRLRFEHIGLNPTMDCYDSCRSGWSYYLGDSLRAMLETGQGKPYADDSEDNI